MLHVSGPTSQSTFVRNPPLQRSAGLYRPSFSPAMARSMSGDCVSTNLPLKLWSNVTSTPHPIALQRIPLKADSRSSPIRTYARWSGTLLSPQAMSAALWDISPASFANGALFVHGNRGGSPKQPRQQGEIAALGRQLRELQMAIRASNQPILIKSDIASVGNKDSSRNLADQYAMLCHLREIVWKAEAEAIERAKSQSRQQ